MSNKFNQKRDPNAALVYQIRLEGQLDSQWMEWFEGLSITLEEDGDSLLTGAVLDQSALHGLLKKVRDLGMTLVSVMRVETSQNDHRPV